MDLENISSDIMDKVITEMDSYDYNTFSDEDIKEDALEYYECLSEKARQGVETIRNEYEKFKQKRDGDSSAQIEGEL